RVRRPTTLALFPYTTLFRSVVALGQAVLPGHARGQAGIEVQRRRCRLVDRATHACAIGRKDLAGDHAHVHALGRAYERDALGREDRKSTRLNSSHVKISYAV